MNIKKLSSAFLLAALLAACATEPASTTTTDKSADGKNCEYRTGSNICRR